MQKLKLFTAFNLFEFFVYFFVFTITAVIFLGALYALFSILILEYSLATMFGIFILVILMFSGYSGIRVFIVRVNHLYHEWNREIIYDSRANTLFIGENKIDLSSKELLIIHHAPRYLLINTEMKYRLKTYSKFEFKINDRSYFVSSVLEFPEDLAKTIRIKTKEKVLKRHIWMTA